MNIKEDYIHFNLENDDILSEIKSKKTMTYDLLEPVVDVLNHLVSVDLKVEGEKDGDVLDVFNIGFRYLYASVDHIRRFLDENFNDDMSELIEYDQNIYLYLRVDELDTLLEEKDQMISSLLDHIDSTIRYKNKIDRNAIDLIEKEIEKALSNTDEVLTSDMFMDFADSLGLELI